MQHTFKSMQKIQASMTRANVTLYEDDGLVFVVGKRRITARRVSDRKIGGVRKVTSEKLGVVESDADLMRYRRGRQARSDASLASLLDEYVTMRELRPKSVRAYRDSVHRVLADIADLPLAKIANGRSVIVAASRVHGVPTARLAQTVAKAIFNYAAEIDDSLGRNPFKFRGFAESRLDNPMTDDELRAWFPRVEAIENPVMRSFMLVSLFTGSRPGELSKARWRDVQDDTLTLTEAKGGRQYTIPLNSEARAALAVRFDDEWLFPSSKGGHIKNWQRHDGLAYGRRLRKTFAAFADRAGVDGDDISRLLGHTIAAMRGRYIGKLHSMPRLREASETVAKIILNAREA